MAPKSAISKPADYGLGKCSAMCTTKKEEQECSKSATGLFKGAAFCTQHLEIATRPKSASAAKSAKADGDSKKKKDYGLGQCNAETADEDHHQCTRPATGQLKGTALCTQHLWMEARPGSSISTVKTSVVAAPATAAAASSEDNTGSGSGVSTPSAEPTSQRASNDSDEPSVTSGGPSRSTRSNTSSAANNAQEVNSKAKPRAGSLTATAPSSTR